VSKCRICKKAIAQDEMAVRIVVEAVSRQDNEGDDAAYWEQIEDWALLDMVHLSCAASESNRLLEFPYRDELNELPLDEIVEKITVPEVVQPPLKLVQGGSL